MIVFGSPPLGNFHVSRILETQPYFGETAVFVDRFENYQNAKMSEIAALILYPSAFILSG